MPDYPKTPAVRVLLERKISFEPYFYTYEEHEGTRHAAAALGVDEHEVIKTLVFETDARKPMLVLMHGDFAVSTKQLARAIGAKQVIPCDPAGAHRHTGYTVGGISPFGTRNVLPVYAETSIFSLPRIFINGGKRGFLVQISPATVHDLLRPTEVSVAIAA